MAKGNNVCYYICGICSLNFVYTLGEKLRNDSSITPFGMEVLIRIVCNVWIGKKRLWTINSISSLYFLDWIFWWVRRFFLLECHLFFLLSSMRCYHVHVYLLSWGIGGNKGNHMLFFSLFPVTLLLRFVCYIWSKI